MEFTEYQAKYWAHRLSLKYPHDDPCSLLPIIAYADINPYPHQLEAAMFAFADPLGKGVIFADEVGLGKTIEAGLVISKYFFLEDKKKILIIAPKVLRSQWASELKDRFRIESLIIDDKYFKSYRKQGKVSNPFLLEDSIVITHPQFASNKSYLLKEAGWDLVVIDEAHRLRNVYKNTAKISKAIKESILPYKKLLLTATPFQNNLDEFRGLISFIDHNISEDKKGLKLVSETIQELLLQRSLRKNIKDIKFVNRLPLIEKFEQLPEEQNLYDGVSEYLRSDELFALPNGNQRYLLALIMRKLMASSSFAIKATLEALADRLNSRIKNSYNAPNYQIWDEEINELYEDDEEDHADDNSSERQYTPEEILKIKAEREWLLHLARMADNIKKNAKGEALKYVLDKYLDQAEEIGEKEHSRKALIFTESRRTQEYLYKQLRPVYGENVIIFNGSNDDDYFKEDRKRICEKHNSNNKTKNDEIKKILIQEFNKSATILIATEAAAEGLNLQFCNFVINYDLPWNPQRIEQRIGRCHRIGQKHDVLVLNLLNESNVVDLRVYDILSFKYKLFDSALGSSDEILGSLNGEDDEINFEKRIYEIVQNCKTNEESNEQLNKLEMDIDQLPKKDNSESESKHTTDNLPEAEQKMFFNSFMRLSEYTLKNFAKFDGDSFWIKTSPFADAADFRGVFKFAYDPQNLSNGQLLTPYDDFGKRIIEQNKKKILPPKSISFRLSDDNNIDQTLKPFIGKSGWLNASLAVLKTEHFNYEILLLAGVTEDLDQLSDETMEHILLLDARVEDQSIEMPMHIKEKLSFLQNELIQSRIKLMKLRRVDRISNIPELIKMRNEYKILDSSPSTQYKSDAFRKKRDEIKLKKEAATTRIEKIILRIENAKAPYEIQKEILEKLENFKHGSEIGEIQLEENHLFTIRWSFVLN